MDAAIKDEAAIVDGSWSSMYDTPLFENPSPSIPISIWTRG